MPSRLILIRHALSAVDPDVDSREWGLAPGAREEAERLATMLPADIGDTIWTSSERKAIDTADAIAAVRGRRIEIDERFGEVRRPWTAGTDDYRTLALGYLAGDVPDGWEDPDQVVERFTPAVDERDPRVVVNHGLAMSLYVASVVPSDLMSFWSDLRFPDAWVCEPEDRSIARLARGSVTSDE